MAQESVLRYCINTHLICQNLGRNLSAVPRWRGVVRTDDFLLHTGEYRIALLCCFADDVDCPDALTIEAHVLRERLAHDGVHTNLDSSNDQKQFFPETRKGLISYKHVA